MTTGMEMSEQPRSRRQTRAAILGHLLQAGGTFRPPLARAVRLSEASLSRILFDLKAEGLIEEMRRPAPYVGGPTGLVSLDGSVALAGLELTGQWLSVGVGGLSGQLSYTERLPLPAKPNVESVRRVFREALTLLRDWTRRIRLAQIGVTIPGLGRLSEFGNPIIPCDVGRIRYMFGEMFANVPVEFTNSVWRTPSFIAAVRKTIRSTLRICSSSSARASRAPGLTIRPRPMRSSRSSSVTWCSAPTDRAAAAAIMAVSKLIRRFRRWPSCSAYPSLSCSSLGAIG
jgi:hypothetical protein